VSDKAYSTEQRLNSLISNLNSWIDAEIAFWNSSILTAFAADTWHSIGTVNGWVGGASYRKSVDQRSVLVAAIGLVPGTITAGTTIWTIPAAWRPASIQQIPVTCDNPLAGNTPRINVLASGAFNIYGISGTTASVNICAEYPIDL